MACDIGGCWTRSTQSGYPIAAPSMNRCSLRRLNEFYDSVSHCKMMTNEVERSRMRKRKEELSIYVCEEWWWKAINEQRQSHESGTMQRTYISCRNGKYWILNCLIEANICSAHCFLILVQANSCASHPRTKLDIHHLIWFINIDSFSLSTIIVASAAPYVCSVTTWLGRASDWHWTGQSYARSPSQRRQEYTSWTDWRLIHEFSF